VAVVCAALAAASFGLLALSAAEQIGQARLQWLRRSPTSIELAESALRRDPGRADYWNWLGLTRDLSQNWRLSGDAYAEAARRAPHDSTFWSNLARSRARQALANDGSSGGASAALDAARRAVDEDPNDSEANFVLGEIASVFGEPELAISAAVKAVVLYPIEPLYEPVVLRSARAMSDLRFAASQLDIALRARDSALIRVAAGEVALRMGDIPTAQSHARRAAELAPNHPEVVKLLSALPR
jgi:cytochrome c-type biogenesis protein CcmH/NrfG